MDEIMLGFEQLKISAFSKYSRLNGDIHNVTIGPNSTLSKKAPEQPKKSQSVITEKKSKVSPHKEQLPIAQVLKEIDLQRREKLNEAINERYNKFANFTKTQRKEQENEWLLKQQAFIRSVQESEQNILQVLDQTSPNANQNNEKLIKHYQDMIQRKMQYEQQLEKNKEKHRVLSENIEKVKKCQVEFRNIYQEIITILKSCTSNEELKKTLGDDFKLLKILSENLEEIIMKCKTVGVDEELLLKAANTVNQLKNLKNRIQQGVNCINLKKYQEEETKAATKEREQANQLKEENQTTVLSINQCVSVSNLKIYTEVKQFHSQYSESFKALVADEQLKQFRFDCKKAVNIPVNALSAVNSEHLKDKYIKLSNLLLGKNVIVSDKEINASRHPHGIPFCKDLLAKKFVLQGDLMISSNPESAFCYAAIIVALWNDFPDFGKLLLGYLYTECPYLVPFYIPKGDGQTMEDYYKTLGYHYNNGQIEKQDKFLKRMTGIFRLYFAILITKPKRGHMKNPHNISNAWRFLASILKLEPQLDITATALHTFLETIGFEMENVYGNAFKKLVKIVINQFLAVLKKIDSGGPVSRLEVLLQDYKTKGHFKKPNGLLPNNFW